jgi:beta-glucosidase
VSDFLWGTATSGHQIEGQSVHADWWTFERRFTPSGDACRFVDHFEADLDRAAAMGTNAFRFSVEWARVEPSPGVRDSVAIDYYARLVRACRARGLEPVLTLVHFTLPAWCEGGWLDERTHAAFDRHVAWVAEALGGDVTWFVTMNEPNVLAGAGYLSGVFPPGRRFRPDLADRCLEALVRAHARAYRILHTDVPRHHAGRTPRVGIAPHVIAWRPSRLDPLGLVRAAGERFDWAVLDACSSDGGRLALALRTVDRPEAKGTLDFAGLNYYMALPADLPSFLRFGGLLRRPVGPGTNDLGWPIDASGFEEVLLEAHRRARVPILVTENGVADATDRLRPGFLRDHVAALRRARARGADVCGYLHWSLIDNFEWHEGYGPRFGLVAVDYATQARAPRASCEVYRQLIAQGPDLRGCARARPSSLVGAKGAQARPHQEESVA